MNKFEKFVKQSEHDKYILNKIKSELEKFEQNKEIKMTINVAHQKRQIDEAKRRLISSENIIRAVELGENFKYEKLTSQYKDLYDNLELKNYFSKDIHQFISTLTRQLENVGFGEEIGFIFEEIIHELSIADYDNEGKLDALFKLRNVRELNTNMVVIGKNGSGKSTFINSFRKDINSNIYTINADRILDLPENKNMGFKYERLKSDFERIFKEDSLDKSGTNYFETVINFLIKHDTVENKVPNENRLTTKVLDLMKDMFPYLNLYIDSIKEELRVESGQSQDEHYSVNAMSSGEKSTLYLISIVLMADKNSYILVDEPEINLNPYLSRKLWDILEELRDDFIYIYASHDRDFASSRINSTYIWNKSFKYPNEWDQEIIDDPQLPKELIFDLLGEEDQKLLVEGTYGSLDYQFYNSIFTDYQVVPLGGHKEVMQAQRVINDDFVIANSKAIIDRDFYPDIELDGLKEKNIYPLEYNTIENLLFKIVLDNKSKFPAEVTSEIDVIRQTFLNYFLDKADFINGELLKYELLYELEGIDTYDSLVKIIDSFNKKRKEEKFNGFFNFDKNEIEDINLMLKVIPLKKSIKVKTCHLIIDIIKHDISFQTEITKIYFENIT